MFTTAKQELKELIALTAEIATLDATLAAKPEIIPADSYFERRNLLGIRQSVLMEKYELYGR